MAKTKMQIIGLLGIPWSESNKSILKATLINLPVKDRGSAYVICRNKITFREHDVSGTQLILLHLRWTEIHFPNIAQIQTIVSDINDAQIWTRINAPVVLWGTLTPEPDIANFVKTCRRPLLGNPA